MELTYIGPNPGVIGVVPLPEGWPAANHDEPDPLVAAVKLTTEMYRERREDDGPEPCYDELAALSAPGSSDVTQLVTPLGGVSQDASGDESSESGE